MAGHLPPTPPKKKQGQHGKPHDWPVLLCKLRWMASPSSLCCFCCVLGFLLGVGVSFVSMFGVVDQDDVKVHLAMVPVAVMFSLRADALTAAQSSPLPVTNWCYRCPSDSAHPFRHIRNGTSCAAPHARHIHFRKKRAQHSRSPV